MASKKRGLGRGLSALIPDNPENDLFKEEVKEGQIVELNISDIVSNKKQPRKEFEEESLDELKDSIKKYGIIQPIVVRKVNNKYEIIAGERRWRAAKKAKLKKVPCIVKDADEKESLKLALIENIQRQDLNPIEEANAYKALMDNYNLKQDEIAEAVGKSRAYISNTLRLLNLDKEILGYLEEGKISTGHGKALLGIKNKEKRLEVAKEIINNSLNVRDAERLVSKTKVKKASKIRKEEKDPFVKEIEDRLIMALGTKVNLKSGKKGGRIEIEYYSEEDLERIFEVITDEQI